MANRLRHLESKSISAALIVIFLLLITLLTYSALKNIESNTRFNAIQSLETVLYTTHETVKGWIRDSEHDVFIIASDPTTRKLTKELIALQTQPNLQKSKPLAKLREHMKTLLEARGDIGFFIISPGYINIASMRDTNVGTKNLIAEHKKEILDKAFKGSPQIIPPIPSDVPIKDAYGRMIENYPTMFTLAPITNGYGDVIAVLALRMDPSRDLSHIAQLGRIGKTGETYFFDKSAKLLTESRFENDLQKTGLIEPEGHSILSIEIRDPGGNMARGFAPSVARNKQPLTLAANNAINGKSGSSTESYRDYRGVEVLGAWLWDDDIGFAMATEIEKNEALTPYYVTQTAMISLVGLATLLSLCLLVTVSLIRKRYEAELHKNSDSLAKAQTIANIGSWDWNIETGEIAWSDQIYRIFGLKPQEFKPTYEAFMERIHPDDRAAVAKAVNDTAKKDKSYQIRHRIMRPNGEERIISERGEITRNSLGKAIHMLGTVHDITERYKAEDDARLSAMVFENSIEGILVTDKNAIIQKVNPAFTTITGYTAEEAIGQNPKMLQSNRQDKKFYDKMWNTINKNGIWSGEIWNRRKNGEAYPEWLTITTIKDQSGEVVKYASVFYDITEMKENQEKIERLAYHDALTGLPNRQLLRDRIKTAATYAEQHGIKGAILFIDLDDFKKANDSLGHVVGDDLLQSVAVRILDSLREEDTVARIGGDEFVVILPEVSDEFNLMVIPNRIVNALSYPFHIGKHEVFIGASVGVTVFPDDGVAPDTLIKNADIAMYRAKETGKGRCSVFTPAMNERVIKRLKLENELRKAIEAKELIPYYQPLVEMRTGEVRGMEALVRWQKEDGEIISPANFLPIAEETGLILQIDEQILRTACAYVKKLNDSRNGKNLYVNVNMSARQLGRRDIVETVISAYTKADLEPENLGLEVTEGIIIDNFDNAVNILSRMRDLGVRILLDDFGTGYSSLSYLKKLPLDVLKMDKTFVSDLPEDKNSRAIAHAITSMAHDLGIKVVAEGVETEGQLEYLKSIGCDIIQGYIYSKPLPSDKLKKFVSEKRQLGEVTRI